MRLYYDLANKRVAREAAWSDIRSLHVVQAAVYAREDNPGLNEFKRVDAALREVLENEREIEKDGIQMIMEKLLLAGAKLI